MARDGFLGELYSEGWARIPTRRAFHTEETDSTSPGEAGPTGPTTPSITAGKSGTVGPGSEVPEGSILIPSEQVTLGAHFWLTRASSQGHGSQVLG